MIKLTDTDYGRIILDFKITTQTQIEMSEKAFFVEKPLIQNQGTREEKWQKCLMKVLMVA